MKGRYVGGLIVGCLFAVTSCTSNKIVTYKKVGSKTYPIVKRPSSNSSGSVYRADSNKTVSKDANRLLKTAKSYLGVPYKYGGTTRSGFDCSGLVFVSFDELGISLPRNSSQQAGYGKQINIKEAKSGDLIFFNTSGKSISHVGIVERIERGGIIHFIHSSTSKGVIISSLDENYWKTRFVKAVRLL